MYTILCVVITYDDYHDYDKYIDDYNDIDMMMMVMIMMMFVILMMMVMVIVIMT
jgi:hypothetical protein